MLLPGLRDSDFGVGKLQALLILYEVILVFYVKEELGHFQIPLLHYH